MRGWAMHSTRIPSLDGMRALAILMVIALHIHQRFPSSSNQTLMNLVFSADGVGIFFVLSGFLITSLLLREYEARGTIGFKHFYLRRTFRILPPLYAYLAFVVVFCRVLSYPLHPKSIAGSALFYLNYFPAGGQWLTEHTWSLCVEEQFYLLWPMALVFVLKRGGKGAAAKLAAALIITAPLLRIATKMSHLAIFDHRLSFLLHTRMDALMSGCLLSLVVGTPKFELLYAKIAKFWWLLPLEFTLVSGALTFFLGVTYRFTVGYTIDSICVALFLVWSTRNQTSPVGNILNSRLMVRIGVLSYSAYIWQTFFIHTENPTWLNRMPWGFIFIWIAALISYKLIEQPAIVFRKYIESHLRADGKRHAVEPGEAREVHAFHQPMGRPGESNFAVSHTGATEPSSSRDNLTLNGGSEPIHSVIQ
jgi:peptidoglycan/LPS O-acetylase OafA/YrhL